MQYTSSVSYANWLRDQIGCMRSSFITLRFCDKRCKLHMISYSQFAYETEEIFYIVDCDHETEEI
jgi:hypothetical protein